MNLSVALIEQKQRQKKKVSESFVNCVGIVAFGTNRTSFGVQKELFVYNTPLYSKAKTCEGTEESRKKLKKSCFPSSETEEKKKGRV